MGLRSLVANSAKSALKAVGDLKATAIFERVTIGAYDPATDAQVETKTTFSVDGVFSNERVDEKSGELDTGSMRFLFSALDIPFVPRNDDGLRIEGARYEIVRLKHVPGRSIYILTVRAT
jgi:hypothetical protein